MDPAMTAFVFTSVAPGAHYRDNPAGLVVGEIDCEGRVLVPHPAHAAALDAAAKDRIRQWAAAAAEARGIAPDGAPIALRDADAGVDMCHVLAILFHRIAELEATGDFDRKAA